MPKISEKGLHMPPSPIRKLVPFAEAAKKRGVHIFHLNIGQPDIKTPEVMMNAIKNTEIKVVEYSHSAGIESYRKKLAGYYQKNKIMVDWRKKLDDSWPVTIHIDNHKWKTVKHYCLGSQFKRGFPDFYLEFSLDSDSKISNDLDLALIAGSESGKLESKILRKPEIIVD